MNRSCPVADVQYNNVNFKSVGRRSFKRVFPYIAMQGCLNGTIMKELLS